MLVKIKQDYKGNILEFKVEDGPEPDIDKFAEIIAEAYINQKSNSK